MIVLFMLAFHSQSGTFALFMSNMCMKDYCLRVLLRVLNSETLTLLKMQSEKAEKCIKCTETDKIDLICC